jgi:transcriptional antiterminator NusG
MPDDIPETVPPVVETPTPTPTLPPVTPTPDPEPEPVETQTTPVAVHTATESETPDELVPEPEPVQESVPEPEPEAEPEPDPEELIPEPAPHTPAVTPVAETSPEEEPEAPQEPSKKRWYIVKVQSNREDSIKEAIERKVKIEGLEEYFGQIIIPVERVQELRRGKRVTKSIKLYPGYLMVEVEFNDRILYLFRETSGVGDFVGGSVGKQPTPMSDKEVARMLHQADKPVVDIEDEPGTTTTPDKPQREIPKLRPRWAVGDRLKVVDGNFAGMEGEVVDLTDERVRLMLTILGRPVPLDLEFWQVETV